jgi:hypothetical protein
MYKALPREVGLACERARKRMGTGYLAYIGGLRDARDALAPDGKFKEWRAAYGLNYGTVKNQLSKAESKLPDNKPLPAPLLKGAKQLVLKFDAAEEKADMLAGLRDVQATAGLKPDDWALAVVWLLDFWHEHRDAEDAA